MGTIQLSGVGRSFKSTAAVSDIDLIIEDGGFVVLLGPSGCGKTTLLRVLAGFVQPEAGRVRIGGQDVLHLPPNRRQVGYVFQNYALFPHLTVSGNVAYGLKVRRVGRAEVSERHANFIVNRGGATATEVLSLMEEMQQAVEATHGVRLHRELRVVAP